MNLLHTVTGKLDTICGFRFCLYVACVFVTSCFWRICYLLPVWKHNALAAIKISSVCLCVLYKILWFLPPIHRSFLLVAGLWHNAGSLAIEWRRLPRSICWTLDLDLEGLLVSVTSPQHTTPSQLHVRRLDCFLPLILSVKIAICCWDKTTLPSLRFPQVKCARAAPLWSC